MGVAPLKAGRGDRRWRLGVVGCGGFSRLAMEAAAALENVELAAVADPVEARRRELVEVWRRAREAAGLPAGAPAEHPDHGRLLRAGAPDVVWVLTPPYLHYPVAREALQAGCHVFVEKPGGLTAEHLSDLLSLAAARRLATAVDFVMRHNPIYRFLKAAQDADVLGPLERLALENNAQGDHMPPGHWFWDESKSGGIWVEHGVHFFDLVALLAGPPAAIAALGARRSLPGAQALPDAVTAVALHPSPHPEATGPATVGYYHGFTRPGPFERTLLTLVYRRAYVEVEGWIAVRLRGQALLDAAGEAALTELGTRFPWFRRIDAEETGRGAKKSTLSTTRDWNGRGAVFTAGRHVVLAGDLGDRWEVYRGAIRDGLDDLIRAAEDPAHRPLADLGKAREALRAALAARRSQQMGVQVRL